MLRQGHSMLTQKHRAFTVFSAQAELPLVLEFDRGNRPTAMTVIPNRRKCQQGIRIILQTQERTGAIGVATITHVIPARFKAQRFPSLLGEHFKQGFPAKFPPDLPGKPLGSADDQSGRSLCFRSFLSMDWGGASFSTTAPAVTGSTSAATSAPSRYLLLE
jgi:hypothetical protein